KLGYHGVESTELLFDGFRTSASSVLGGEAGVGQGFKYFMSGIEVGRVNVAARGVGIAQAALDDSLRYAQQRETFGKPIAHHQAVQLMLAKMATRAEAARLLVVQAAERKAAGERADLEAGMAKYFATEAAQENALDAMRIHGGYGYSPEFRPERYYRDAPLLLIGEGPNLRHGSDEQKQRYLPRIASGELRLQAFGVTEPTAGSDTTSLQTTAVREDGRYVVRGQKIWTSRALHSDLMLLLARTTPLEQVEKKTEGLSTFIVDMKDALAAGTMTIRPIKTLMNHATTEIFFDGVEVPADALVGEEGKGFRYILDGMNAERILIAAECIGDGRWFVEKATAYASERVVFGRPIGQNQGVQFPIAQAHAAVEAADLMRYKAAWLFEQGEPCGPEANLAKLLASEASWQAANACLDTHGGFGFAEEYDVE